MHGCFFTSSWNISVFVLMNRSLSVCLSLSLFKKIYGCYILNTISIYTYNQIYTYNHIYIDIYHICTVPVIIFPPLSHGLRLIAWPPRGCRTWARPPRWTLRPPRRSCHRCAMGTAATKRDPKGWSSLGKSWENPGKIWENLGNSAKLVKKIWISAKGPKTYGLCIVNNRNVAIKWRYTVYLILNVSIFRLTQNSNMRWDRWVNFQELWVDLDNFGINNKQLSFPYTKRNEEWTCSLVVLTFIVLISLDFFEINSQFLIVLVVK